MRKFAFLLILCLLVYLLLEEQSALAARYAAVRQADRRKPGFGTPLKDL